MPSRTILYLHQRSNLSMVEHSVDSLLKMMVGAFI